VIDTDTLETVVLCRRVRRCSRKRATRDSRR